MRTTASHSRPPHRFPHPIPMKRYPLSPTTATIAAMPLLLMGYLSAHAVADDGAPPAAASSAESPAGTASPVDFSRDVLPILRNNCLACHNEKLAEAGLSLESVDAILKGGDSGPAIDREHAAASLLVARARSEDEIMPPEDNDVGAKPLTGEQLETLERWIAAGAPDAGATVSNLELWQPLPAALQAVYAVRFSPTGDRLAVGRGNAIEIHEIPTGRPLQTLTDPALALSNHPPEVPASAGSAESLSQAAHLDYVNALAFHPDGELLASGGFRSLKLWRRATEPTELQDAAVRTEISAAILVPPTEHDEATLQRVAAWDLGGAELRQLVRDRQEVRAVTVTKEGAAKLWDWVQGAPIAELAGDPVLERRVTRQEHAVARQQAYAAFLESQIPAAETFSTSEEEARQKVEQSHQKLLEDLQAKQAKLAEAEAALKALDGASEEGQSDAAPPAANAEQRIALEKQRDEAKTAVDAAEVMVASAAQALAAAKDARDQAVAALAQLRDDAEQQRLHGAELEKELEAIRQAATAADGQEAMVAAFSPDGSQVAVAFAGGDIGLFASSDGRPLTRLRHGPASTARLAFVDGGWLAAIPPPPHDAADSADIGPSEDAVGSDADPLAGAAIWTVAAPWKLDRVIGDPLGESPFTDRIVALDFSPDGAWLVVGGGDPSRFGEVHLISVADAKMVTTWSNLHSDVVLGVRVSPDGRQLATCSADRQVRLVDFPSGENMRSLEGHTHHVLAVDWQDDGRRLVSASADKTIKIWSVRNRGVERTIAAGNKEVSSVAFVGTTSQFAAASGEGQVVLYDANDGGQKRVYAGVASFQHAVATDRTGEMIAAGGEDGTLRIWKTAAPEPIP